MAREFSVLVGINAGPARRGAREFKAASDTVVRGSRRMDRGLKSTNRRAIALITTIGRIRGVATLAFSGFLGVGGLAAVTRTISQFQTEMSRVNALLGERGTTGVMGALTDRARELGATTIFTATQAAEGIRFLTLAGFNAAESFAAVDDALNLAAAGMLDLGTSADLLSNIMTAFNVAASNATDVADGLAIVAARSNTSIRQLGEAMKFVGPVAGNLGIDVKDASAALGILGNAGLQASLAGTSLRRVISGLLNPSKEAEKVLGGMGLKQEELIKTLQGPDGLILLMEDFAKAGVSTADAFTLFGVRGAPGFLQLINNIPKLKELTAATREFGGEAERQAKILADNLGGDARAAISAMQEAILALADAGLGVWLRETVQGFTGFVRALAGVKTPADDLTEAMESGYRTGELLLENWNKLKVAAVALAVFLSRRLIVALVAATLQVWSFGAALTAGATAMQVLNRVIALSVLGFKRLRAAITSTGIGAIAVAIGLIAAYAISTRDAAEENEELKRSLEDIATEAEKATVKFGQLGEAQDRVFLRQQEERVRETAEALQDAAAAVKEQELALKNLAFAESLANETAEKAAEVRHAAAMSGSQFASVSATMTTEVKRETEAQEGLRRTQELAKQDRDELLAQLEKATAAYQEQATNLQLMTLVQQGFASSVSEARKKLEAMNSAKEDAAAATKKLTGFDLEEIKAIQELIKKYDAQAIKVAELEEEYELINRALEGNAAAMAAVGTNTTQLTRAKKELAFQLRKAQQELTPYEEAWKTVNDKMAKALIGTDKVKMANYEHANSVRALMLEMIAANVPIEERIKVINAMNEAHDRAIKKMKESCESARETAGCQSEAAKRIQSIWDQAMRNVQDAFADAFKGAFNSSTEFFDKIVGAFKDMIAEMLAAWFSSGIMNILGGQAWGTGGNTLGTIFSAFGGGGGGAGGTAASGGGIFNSGGQFIVGLGKSITAAFKGSALYASLVGFGKAAVQGASLFLNSGFSGAQIATGGSFGATAGAVGVGAGIGALTGTVANQVFGGRGDPTRNAIFSTIGGAIGAYFGGPPGAVIGGAIGSFVDNLIGGAKKLESAVLELDFQSGELRAQTETVVSTQRSFFRGRKFKTTTDDVSARFSAVQDLLNNFFDTLVYSAEALGATVDGLLANFEFSQIINTKGRSEESIAQSIERFITNVMQSGIDSFLNTVEGLEPYIEATLQTVAQGLVEGLTTNYDAAVQDAQQAVESGNFAGGLAGLVQRLITQSIAAGNESSFLAGEQAQDNVESFVAALQSLVKITGLLGGDLVSIVEEIETAAGRGSIENYQLVLDTFREMLAQYDGSVPALMELADATQVVTETQVALIAVYRELGRELSDMFQSSAQSVREALLNEEELYNLRRSQIDALVEQAQGTTDPEELRRLAEEINRLGLDAFNLLDEGQQGALGQEFIDFFEGLDDLFGEQIMSGIGAIQDDQAILNQEVADRLLEVAQAQLDAANSARDTFDEWREWLQRDRDSGGASGTRTRELIP